MQTKSYLQLLFFLPFFLLPSFIFAQNDALKNWEIYTSQGATAYQSGDYNKAVLAYEQALEQSEKAFGTTHEYHILSMTNLLAVYKTLRKFDKAAALVSKVLEAIKEKFGEKKSLYSLVLSQLAMVYDAQAMYDKAQTLHIKALHTLKETAGEQHLIYQIALNNLAKSYYEQGKYKYAEPLWSDIVTTLKREYKGVASPFAEACFTALHNLASLYHKVGLYAKSEVLFGNTKVEYEKIYGKESLDYALLINDLATLYQDMGDYRRAESLYLESKSSREKILGKQNLIYNISLHNLATFYYQIGNHDKAEPLFLESMQVINKVLGKENPEYIVCLNNLAELYRTKGNYPKAEKIYLEAQEICKKTQYTDALIVLMNLAELYRLTDRYAEAETLFLKAKTMSQQSWGQDHPYYAYTLGNLALLYETIGKNDLAEVLYVEIKALSTKLLENGNSHYVASLQNLAVFYANRSLYDKAIPLLIQSVQSIAKSMQTNFINLSENEKRLYISKNQIYFHNFYDFLNEILQKEPQHQDLNALLQTAFDLRLLTKGALLSASQKIKKRIWDTNNASLINQFSAWQKLRNDIANAYNMPAEVRQVKGLVLEKLLAEAEEIEKQLALRSADFQQAFAQKSIAYQSIQHKLHANEVAIEIIRTTHYNRENQKIEPAYVALILTNKDLTAVLLKNSKDLEDKFFNNYKNRVALIDRDKSSYAVFWEEIAEKLTPTVHHIYFSPDGIYNYININTLQNPKTKQFILEEQDIQVVSNLKEILETRKENTNKTASLFGKPDYTMSKKEHQKSLKNFKRNDEKESVEGTTATEVIWRSLYGTEVEVQEIEAILKQNHWQTETFLDKDALEERVKKVQNPTILHIATHGYFKEDKQNKQYEMLRSGIILAGVNSTEKVENSEDGVLTALEATDLQLDTTELVVLSACETGLGAVYAGEGVYGLQRGLKVAGAKAIIMSLWDVDDEITQKLMITFYNLWLSGDTKRVAFKKAQLKIKEENKKPIHWGAFVMIGE
jgi:CHAT domain-containing protein/tetratricopeptide (TPR) repeat protein